MTTDFPYDPVTALDEAAATGRTAGIFADIRETMGIPLITSIWRGLADMGDSLETVWQAAKPIYLSGCVEPALERVVQQSGLPAPQPLTPGDFLSNGVGNSQLGEVCTIVNAYNRSNGMNMVALAALIAPVSGRKDQSRPRTLPVWGPFPALLARDAIDSHTWDAIRQVNAIGASAADAHVATLWRHLGHWPGLLSLVSSAFAPVHADGSIMKATERMISLVQQEATRLAAWRNEGLVLPDPVRKTLTGYVTSPTQVARMVTVGHALANWLPRNGRS